MIFAGCSTSPSQQKNSEVVLVTVPAHLLQEFCEWKKAGETVGDLASGFVHNTVCGMKYETQVREQKEYLRKMGVQ